MNQYIINEIQNFRTSNIPLIEYPKRAKAIRNKINKYTNMELLYLKKMLYKNEIGKEDYNYTKMIIEYEKEKYQQMLNNR